jgi:hypothetical protein
VTHELFKGHATISRSSYRHIAAERYREHDADPKGLGFYFSALSEQARSVTWAMKAEEPDRYAAWPAGRMRGILPV